MDIQIKELEKQLEELEKKEEKNKDGSAASDMQLSSF